MKSLPLRDRGLVGGMDLLRGPPAAAYILGHTVWMFFYTIRSWVGAALTVTWGYFVLFGLSVVVFAVIEPNPARGVVLSAAAGAVVGAALAAYLVSMVNHVHRLRVSVRSWVTGILLVVPSVLLYMWANPADPDSSPVVTSVPMYLVPAAVMGGAYLFAGWALVDR